MVQITCTILRTQGTEGNQRREWAVSFGVGVWQQKPRLRNKQVVL